MSKRKVQFDETATDSAKGSRRFKEKHSLDSDEEDVEEDVEQLDDEDIEGQEDGSVGFDEGIKITPFNMKEEMEEGHFDKDGMYIFDKNKGEIRDEWMDNIDWQRIKEREADKDDQDSDSSGEEDTLDLCSIYKQMLEHVKPNETVAKALRRLGGNKGKQMSSAQRWKAKKQKTTETEEDKEAAKDKEDFLTLTGLADKVLSGGYMEVYEITYEKLNFEVKKFEKAAEKDTLEVPEDMDDDDALDMFADDLDKKDLKKEKEKVGMDFEAADGKGVEKGKETGNEVQEVNQDGSGDTMADAAMEKADNSKVESNNSKDVEHDAVMWEYKWSDEDSEEVHGPYSSAEMLEWAEDGYFKSGVFCRKAGTNSQFYTSKRIDFDLYT